jgi:hypothetical protein
LCASVAGEALGKSLDGHWSVVRTSTSCLYFDRKIKRREDVPKKKKREKGSIYLFNKNSREVSVCFKNRGFSVSFKENGECNLP